jgi:hypothetical protein
MNREIRRRELYSSPNGDRCLLCKEPSGSPFVAHQENIPSVGHISRMELGDFLCRGKGLEQQALPPGRFAHLNGGRSACQFAALTHRLPGTFLVSPLQFNTQISHDASDEMRNQTAMRAGIRAAM